MPSVNPLTPVEFRLRQDLGTHGDTGVELHAKVDRIKSDTENILSDTADMQPKLGTFVSGTAAGDIAAVKAVVDSIDTDAGSIISLLTDADFGLDAIDNAVEAAAVVTSTINTKIGTPVVSVSADIAAVKAVSDSISSDTQGIIALIGTPDQGSVSADIADIASRVDQIQNNTRTTIAMLAEMEAPAVGQTEYYLIQLNNYDSIGAMEEPDTAPVVTVKTFAGVDRSANLRDDADLATTTMVKDADGRYHIKYRITDAHNVNEGLMFTFVITEGGVTRVIDRVSRVVEEVSSTFTAADRANLIDVLADTADIQPKIGTPSTTVSGDIAAAKAVIDATKVVVDNIQLDTDDIQSNLDLIMNKDGSQTYSRATDSLEAISEAIANVANSAVAPKLLRALKTSGSITAGNSEVVVLDAATGVASPYNILKELRVVPTTQTSTNFTVEIFEDAAATIPLLKFEKANASKNDLRLAMDLVYINQEATPANKIYVKISNVNDSSSSVFNVELRGHMLKL